MEGYVRFSSSSPPANPPASSSSRRFSTTFQEAPSLDSSDSTAFDSPQQQDGAMPSRSASNMWGMRGSSWSWLAPPPFQQVLQRWRTPSRSYQSNYMTLVPLSDDRLKPRRTALIVSSVCLLALVAITGVFLLVPRGISVGTIEVHSTKMTFNSTTKTYRIILQADVPIYNPNYLQASVSGNLSVSFYDAEAGWSALGPVMLGARTNPQTLSVYVDASNVPRKYTRVVYDQCFGFPRILVFFLLGTFQTTYLGYKTELPSVDTYFLLDCSGAQDLGGVYNSSSSSNSLEGSSSSSLHSMLWGSGHAAFNRPHYATAARQVALPQQQQHHHQPDNKQQPVQPREPPELPALLSRSKQQRRQR